MTIDFYNCADANNVIDKTLTDKVTVSTVQPVEPCDFLNPSFIMNKSATTTGKNYCYIGAPLSRHYFVTGYELLTGGRVLVKCSIDVLKTYASGIGASTGTVLRAEKPISKALHDNKYPLAPNMDVVNILYPETPFDYTSGDGYYNYLLTVVGGGA